MESTKLYKTLAHFSVYEMNSLAKFVASPYFNQNQNVGHLFTLLQTHFKEKEDGDGQLNKQKLWNEIFETDYVDVKFRKLCSDLFHLVEDFIAQKNFESHPYNKPIHLLQALGKRKLGLFHSKALSNASRIGERQLERSSSYYLYNYEINKNKYGLTSEFEKKSAKEATGLQTNLKDLLHNLDFFYITEKLRYYCTVLSWKKLKSFDEDLLLINEILESVEENNLTEIPSISVYYCIAKTMLDPEDDTYYYRLKKHIEEDIDLFPSNEIRDIYDSAVSYCISRYNAGNYAYTSEVLDIYKESLENASLFVRDQMTPTTFRNIVFFAGRAKEYEWGIHFINNYADLLEPKYRQNAINFSLARIHFYQKDYEKVVHFLNLVDYEDVWYNLNSKAILISAYYELGELNALESLLNSFKVYINRNKSIPSKRQDSYNNLIRFTGQLIKLLPSEKGKIEKLKEKVLETKSVTSRPWLVQKIDDLGQK